MRETYLKVYIAVLGGLALALSAAWVYWYGLPLEPRFAVAAAVFASLIFLGEVFPLRVSDETSIGAWDIGLVLAVATVGPTWAAVAALPAALYGGRRDLLRTGFEVGHAVTVVYLAGIVFSFASTPLLAGASASAAQVMYGALAASLALLGSNAVIMALLVKVKYGRSLHQTWKEDIAPYLLSDLANMLTAGFGVLALVVYGPLTAVVVVAGAIGSQVLVHRSRGQLKEIWSLRKRVSSLEEALNISNTAFGTMIVRDLGRRDGYTDRHAVATAVYAADLGRELKLDEAHVGRLRMAGLLHNVGLFGLPEELLVQTGQLNSIARSRLAEHAARGEEALAAVPEFEEMARWVRWHHERIDGRGYPDKLRGPWIPLEAKILAVAQAFAAIVLDQPRRPGLGFAEARQQLCAGVDTEFDGVVVRALVRILDTETEGYRMADDYRFVFPDPTDRGDTVPSQELGVARRGHSR